MSDPIESPAERLDDCGHCALIPSTSGEARAVQVSCPTHGSGDLPVGQQSKPRTLQYPDDSPRADFWLLAEPPYDLFDDLRAARIERALDDFEARVLADVAEEIARAIERDDMAMYAWEAARIARGCAVAPAESVVGALPTSAGTAEYKQGYGEAVRRLRNDDAYRSWWTARDYPAEQQYWRAEARGHLADYLETLVPDPADPRVAEG